MEPGQKTTEVSTEELRTILLEKRATVFDARSFKEYAVSHIPGTLSAAAEPGFSASGAKKVSSVLQGNKGAPIVLYSNGPFCIKSKRLAEELIETGYTNVRRYQLGIPVWRALGGLTQIEAEGVQYIREKDQTAVWIDARDPQESSVDPVLNARNLPLDDVAEAKKDGRLPMDDRNTRIIVFGRDGAQAQAVAEAVTQIAFHNVSYYVGPVETLRTSKAVRPLRENNHVSQTENVIDAQQESASPSGIPEESGRAVAPEKAANQREIERLEGEIASLLAEARQDPSTDPSELDSDLRNLYYRIDMLRLVAMDSTNPTEEQRSADHIEDFDLRFNDP